MKENYGRLYIRPDEIAELEVPFTGAVINFQVAKTLVTVLLE